MKFPCPSISEKGHKKVIHRTKCFLEIDGETVEKVCTSKAVIYFQITCLCSKVQLFMSPSELEPEVVTISFNQSDGVNLLSRWNYQYVRYAITAIMFYKSCFYFKFQIIFRKCKTEILNRKHTCNLRKRPSVGISEKIYEIWM